MYLHYVHVRSKASLRVVLRIPYFLLMAIRLISSDQSWRIAATWSSAGRGGRPSLFSLARAFSQAGLGSSADGLTLLALGLRAEARVAGFLGPAGAEVAVGSHVHILSYLERCGCAAGLGGE